MNMIEAQRKIIKQACFNDRLLGEHILYNGVDIVAVPEIGATLARTDWNDSATTIESAAIGDLAAFSVCMDDVPDPQEGDHIEYQGKVYKVASVTLVDSVGGVYVLNTMVNGRGIGK